MTTRTCSVVGPIAMLGASLATGGLAVGSSATMSTGMVVVAVRPWFVALTAIS